MELTTINAQDLADLPRDRRNEIIVRMAESFAFDFVDFGTHKGNGIRFGLDPLGGMRGMGVELNDAKVVENLRSGLFVYSGDVNAIPLTGQRFKFGICRHVLEHMPDAETVRSVLASLARMCSDYIYIEQPDITHEAYLNSLGLMSMHSTLAYHTCLMTDSEISETLHHVGLDDFTVAHLVPQQDSANRWIHAIGSPPNRWTWSESDLPKPMVTFDRMIYRDIVFLVRLAHGLDAISVLKRIPRIAIRA